MPAIFISSDAARRFMGTVPWYPGRTIVMRPVYKHRAFAGYQVILCGRPVTEEEVQ